VLFDCVREKRSEESTAMAATRKTTKKAAPARKGAARKAPARKAAARPATAAAQKPASMTGPLPAIVTLRHLAEWAGYNHGIPRKQAIAMFAGFVEDVSRVLKRGSRIRIPDLGILQVRTRPARPARMGRNPATGESIQIKASPASKRVAFRPAKTLKQSV
jgi:DNA-binding protein HU-beta